MPNKNINSINGKGKPESTIPFYKLFIFADRVDAVLMVVGSVAAVGNGITQPLMTLFMAHIIDSFATSLADAGGVVHHVSKVCLKLFFLAIYAGILSSLQVTCWIVTGERQSARIRRLYLDTILRQDIAFFDTESSTGEVIGRMSGDTVLIQDAMGEKVAKFIQLMTTFLGGFTIAFVRGWKLALILLPFLPAIVLAGAIMALILAKMSSRAQLAYAEAGNVVEETIGAIRTVASFTGEKDAIRKYKIELQVAYRSTVYQGLVTGVGRGTITFLIFGTYAVCVWYGSKMIIHNGYNGGQVLNVIMALMTGGTSLGQTSPCITAFAAGKAAAYKMFETIEREPKIDTQSTKGIVLEDMRGEIELKNVHFHYPSRPEVEIFSGFSLHIPSGITAALVGESGSGKSTVISLMERFYDPDSGKVLIDGVDFKLLRLSWARQMIGLVSQEPILFTTTIRENIKYGKEDANEAEIISAVERANAAKFTDKLPQGLDTLVGEHGTQLSGGQKQRIAIARAILKNPRILLLDEATSALDAESERVVQEALDRIMLHRTTVVVAHRVTTIKNADIIAVIHQGKLVEQGTHEELIQDPLGAYTKLVQLQQGRHRLSMRRSVSRDSSSGRRSFPYSNATIPLSDNNVSNKDNEEAKMKPKKVSVKRLAYLNKPELPVLLLGSIAASVNGVIFPVFGLLLSSAINIFYEPQELLHKDSRFWTLIYLALSFTSLVIIPGQNYFFGIAGGRLIRRIRLLTFKKVVHEEISWFDDHANSSGAIGARLSTDTTNVRGLVGDQLALIMQNIATVFAALVIAFAANWMLALIILAMTPVMFSQSYFQAKFMRGFSSDAKLMYEEASQVANDAVGGIRTVASFCSESKVMELYENKCEAPLREGVRKGLLSGFGFGFSFFALYCVNALCFYTGALLIHQGKAKFSDVFKVFFALTISATGIAQSSSMAMDSTKAKESVASIFNILDRAPKIDSSCDQGATLGNLRGDVTFHNVSFKYPTRTDVHIFKNLCLRVPPKKTVALVGESGCGKSTIISLIERFYDVESGQILLDGVDIRKLKLSWLRSQIGLVSQEPILFNNTIRANIAYGKQANEVSPTEDEIVNAANLANAHAFVSGLPQGYDTNVGERGVQLSGGQKQRIAIARAIVKDPKILLLDEATSALDAESERVVQAALVRVMVERTTLVVAHRLSTVKNADVIVVLKNGTVAEKGKHEELIKMQNGAYASLVALQMRSGSV
ncbi:hypothetical protein V2J09_019600 [Rumex salicifolius]